MWGRVMDRSDKEGRAHAKRSPLACLAVALVFWGAPLHGQATMLIDPTLPDDYNQSRNVSVIDRPRPDYDPLGVRIGSFVAYPSLALGVGGSDNVYVTSESRKGDFFARLAPALDVRSDWDRNLLRVTARAVIPHYAEQSPLDRNTWDIRPSGRLDIGDFTNVAIDGQVSKLQEDPFTSQTDASLAVLSSYRQNALAVRAVREVGRTRLLGSFDATQLRFSDIQFTNGQVQSQAQRDRSLTSGAAQAEYALSPGAVVIARLTYTDTDYVRKMIDRQTPNRDARTLQALAGLNLDLPDFLRGTFQLGYTHRDYVASAYRSVGGVSGEMKIEYFLSDIMNFEVDARRVLQDSATSENNPYFEDFASLSADRSIRENIIASIKVGGGNQNYIGSPIKYNIIQVSGSVKYLVSRMVSLRLDTSFAKRAQSGSASRSKIDQSTIMMTMELHK